MSISIAFKVGSTLYVRVRNIRRADSNAVPTTYGTLQCRVLASDGSTEVIGAVTMSQVSGTNDIACEIPYSSTASLTSGTNYRLEISAIIDTSRKRLFISDAVTATTN